MIEVVWRGGVWLPSCGLALDPRRPCDLAFVSHAHSDHTAAHRRTVCTPLTARLIAARFGGGGTGFEEIEYGGRREFGEFIVRLVPAGHVPGSAMIHLESGEGTLLYTGDFKLRRGWNCEAAAPLPAETLIMETTYGLPRYEFPEPEAVLRDLIRFCADAHEDGETPVLLGYSLGKAQEILAALSRAGFPIFLHPGVWTVTRLVEDIAPKGPGAPVYPAYQKFESGKPLPADAALIFPPGADASLRRVPGRRVAAVTGWALDPGFIYRAGCDAAFPLSDHASYAELLRCVELVAPKRVLTLHGFASEFAADLRARGVEAWALSSANQLELSLGLKPSAGGVSVAAAPPEAGEPGSDEDLPAGTLAGFARLCGRVRATRSKLRKVRELAVYFQSVSRRELPVVAEWLAGGMLTPGEQSSRPLRVGGALIRSAVLAVSGLALNEYRAVSRRFNDSSLAAREIFRDRVRTSTLSVPETVGWFEKIGAARGSLAKAAVIEGFIRLLSAGEIAVVIGLLNGNLRIGLREGLVENAIAAAFDAAPGAVRETLLLCGSPGETALLAAEGRLESASMSLFRPVQVMLASVAADEESLHERMVKNGAGELWAEDKLDGIRAQLHHSPRRTEIFSRDGKAISSLFPEIVGAAEPLPVSCVLDGEIVAFRDGRALDFALLQRRLGRVDSDLFLEGEIPVAYRVFDLLYLDGREIWREPLARRRELLDTLPFREPIGALPVRTAASPRELAARFLEAKARGNEGLVVKNPLSAYAPGRRGMEWIKLKKALATLDVVVVAAEFGHGKRAGLLSDYTFAVRGEDGGLLTVGKAYSGLTDAEIADLTTRFFELEISRRGNKLTVRPEVVLEVAFDSIRPSTRHASGFALRFPRIKRIRADKGPALIDTLATVRSLAGAF